MAYKIRSIKFNFLMNLLLTGSSILFPLITFPIVSRALLADAYGLCGFAMTVASWLSLIAMLGVNRYGVREVARVRDDGKLLAKTTREIFLVTVFSTVVVYICFFISLFLVQRFEANRTLLFINGFTILCNTLGVTWFFQGIEQYSYITIRGLIIKVVCLIAIIFLVHVPSDYLWYAGILVAANGLANLVNFFYMMHIAKEAAHGTSDSQGFSKEREKSNLDACSHGGILSGDPSQAGNLCGSVATEGAGETGSSKFHLQDNNPCTSSKILSEKLELKKHLAPLGRFFIIVAAISIYTSFDTVMLGFLSTSTEVGYYTADINVKNALVAVISALSGVLLPRASNMLAKGQKNEFKKIVKTAVKWVLIVSIPMCIVASVVATPLMTWYAGDAFAGAGPALSVVTLAVIPIGLSVIFCDEVMVPLGLEKLCSYIYIAAALINFGLNFITIPLWGAFGAALSTAFVEVLIAVVEFCIVRKYIWGNKLS